MATREVDLGLVVGKSAYQYAQEGGYTGTEAQFAAKLAASQVNSFNGRTGTVTPAAGDYTAAMVGAAPAVEDPNNPGCYYRMVGGVQEWINPPMSSGVEYRTAERYNGSPVYKKLIVYTHNTTIGTTLGRETTNIPHGVSRMQLLLDVQASTSDYCLPLITGEGTTAIYHKTATELEMVTYKQTWMGTEASPRAWYITIRYTKY